jgi:hypothetical protein
MKDRRVPAGTWLLGWLVLLSVAVLASGCGDTAATTPGPTGAASGSASADAPKPPAPPPPLAPGEGAAGPGTSGQPGAAAGTTEGPPPGMERAPAVTGIGKRGRGYGGGIITTPLAERFRQEDRLNLMVIAQPMNLYRAEHGYFPKTQKEFMEKIIAANDIKLPELPPGERYIYDVEKAAKMTSYDIYDPPLLVERPQ